MLVSSLLRPPTGASKPIPKPEPRKNFPTENDEITPLLSEMARSYEPNIANYVKLTGMRGKEFRFNNNQKNMHGYVKVINENIPAHLSFRESQPLYTFPYMGVGLDFVSAPDGIYTWVLYEKEGGAIGFAATHVLNKMELGVGHQYTLSKLGINKEFKVPFSGELRKEGKNLSINISSGSYMKILIEDITGKYNIKEAKVNSILLTRAQQLLQATLGDAGFSVSIDEGAYKDPPISLINSTTTPLTKNYLEHLATLGTTKFHFIPNTNLATYGIGPHDKDSVKSMSNSLPWKPFLPEAASMPAVGGGKASAAVVGGGAGAVSSSTRKRRQRRRNITCRN